MNSIFSEKANLFVVVLTNCEINKADSRKAKVPFEFSKYYSNSKSMKTDDDLQMKERQPIHILMEGENQ